MSTQCIFCSCGHRDRKAVNEALRFAREPKGVIAARFQVTEAELDRHRICLGLPEWPAQPTRPLDCVFCSSEHRDRTEINVALGMAREPLAVIARRFQVTEADLARHRICLGLDASPIAAEPATAEQGEAE